MDKVRSVRSSWAKPFGRARLRPMPGIARGLIYHVAPPAGNTIRKKSSKISGASFLEMSKLNALAAIIGDHRHPE
jgi:hypothetical protein